MPRAAPAIRPARHGDVDTIVAIKHALRLAQNPAGGGFLLGASPATYHQLIDAAIVRVVEFADQVVGFTTALPDPILRQSEVWLRRQEIDWQGFDPAPIEQEPIAYFDQLAVVPGLGARMAGLVLALRTVDELFRTHKHFMTTTVLAPVKNQAAWPLLALLGAKQVGSLREHYPEVGEIVSAIFYASRSTYRRNLDRMWFQASAARRRLLVTALGPR
ncbi:MAG: hypothetical protein ACPG77_05375 [Nannocystaceae bacterium]